MEKAAQYAARSHPLCGSNPAHCSSFLSLISPDTAVETDSKSPLMNTHGRESVHVFIFTFSLPSIEAAGSSHCDYWIQSLGEGRML